MLKVAARELKQNTGEVLARVQRGERVLLTHRGSPIAVITPIDQTKLERAIEKEADRAETLGWLAASESALSFWENEADDVWDQVEVR